MNTSSQIPTCHLELAIRSPPQNSKPKIAISASSEKNFRPITINISDIIATLKNSVIRSFSNVLNPPLHPSVNPIHVFKGNFAPVEEMEPTKCQLMEGELPLSLDGVYIRNGPNPQHRARRAQHLFEGDGMLHSLRFSKGDATYCNRYVKTHKFNVERVAALPVFPNMLSGLYGLLDILHLLMFIKTTLTGHLDILNGIGVANTSLALVSGKLVALCESDLPYIVELTQEGDLETLGRWEIDRKLFSNMTAHPKLDMETKETFAFSWSFISPHLTFFRLDERGEKQNEVPIFSIRKPSFIHDFAITKRYAIFHETQLVYSLPKVLMGKGSPLVYKPDKSTRIGIIPRYAESDSDMKWFDIPGFNAIHIINAWENGNDEIVMVTSNLKSVENFLHCKKQDFVLDKVKINTKTGSITRNILSDRNLDLGSINKAYTGKKSRYAYVGVLGDTPKTCGLVKIDMEAGKEVGKRFYGDGCFGGEPLFVRRKNGEEGEDDGYVMTIVHNEHSNESMFLLMDAKSSDFSTIAAVKLPSNLKKKDMKTTNEKEANAVFDLIEFELEKPDQKHVTELVINLLAHLCSCAEGRAQFLRHAGSIAMIAKRILRVSPTTDNQAVHILSLISKYSATKEVLLEMLRVGAVTKLCMVIQADCDKNLKHKANGVLRLHSNLWNNSPCIAVYLLTRYQRN